jgi:threonine/homoserine/homoserine lactone efflux protein
MNIGLLIKSFVIGLSIAAVVGPISVLCIQRTLSRGYIYGLISGLGIATADGTYGSVAAFGLTAISTFLVHEEMWIRAIGGAFLLYLGIRTILSKPAEKAATAAKAHNLPGAYASILLLTLTNPLTILSFAAIFAGIGVSGGKGGYLAATLVVLGVFLGSATWWLILTSSVSLLRRKITPRWLVWLNRISGAVLVIFGIVALISVI